MKKQAKKPRKVTMTLSITKEAQDIMFDVGYASARTVGAFVSQLIVEHHIRCNSKPTPGEIAFVLRDLADKLDKG
jgi:hypothetical protein